MTTTQTEGPAYTPSIDPSRATVEETDAWILSLGGKEVNAQEMTAIVGETRWSRIPGENPGDPDFPLAKFTK